MFFFLTGLYKRWSDDLATITTSIEQYIPPPFQALEEQLLDEDGPGADLCQRLLTNKDYE